MARRVQRWSDEERRVVARAVCQGWRLDQVAALFPRRSRDSVKDVYYSVKSPQERDPPASISDARYRKDCAEGSEALLRAIIEHHPHVVSLPRSA